MAQDVKVADLKDPFADVMGAPAGLPATDANRTKPGKESWLIMIGICTHLGCIPKVQAPGDERGPYGGWFVHAMVQCTIRRDASVRGPRRVTLKYRRMISRRTPRLRSAKPLAS